MIEKWWTDRGSTAPQQCLLPPVGVVSELEHIPIACAFLYQVQFVPIGIVEWECTNPDISSALLRLRGLNKVFDFFETFCADQGIKTIFSWVAKGRGDGRLLAGRHWVKCEGERHELMAFSVKEEACLP